MAAQAHPQRNSCHRQGTGISGDQQGGWQATTGSDQRSGGCKAFLIACIIEVRRLSSHAKRAGKGTDRSTPRPQTHAAGTCIEAFAFLVEFLKRPTTSRPN